jgi:hypothetical protein
VAFSTAAAVFRKRDFCRPNSFAASNETTGSCAEAVRQYVTPKKSSACSGLETFMAI